jgi:hypothetical protein
MTEDSVPDAAVSSMSSIGFSASFWRDFRGSQALLYLLGSFGVVDLAKPLSTHFDSYNGALLAD